MATSGEKLPGYTLISSVDQGYAETYENSLKAWIKYPNQGQIWGSDAMSLMSTEDMNELGNLLTKVLGYMERHTYEFIKGTLDIDSEEDWGNWCTMMKKYNYQRGTEIFQPYIDQNPFVE